MSIKTTSFSGEPLPLDISREIVKRATEGSTVMKLAHRIPVSGRGEAIPAFVSNGRAEFVEELAKKPNNDPETKMITILPKKIANIVVLSDESLKDINALESTVLDTLAASVGERFDEEVFGTATTYYADALGAIATAQSLDSDVYDAFVDSLANIAEAKGKMNGIALSAKGQAKVMKYKDTTGQPIFLDNVTKSDSPGIFGVPTYVSNNFPQTGNIVGYAADWSTAIYGIADEISLTSSKEATVNGVNLFEQNATAVRVEARIGFAVGFADQFIKLTSSENVLKAAKTTVK